MKKILYFTMLVATLAACQTNTTTETTEEKPAKTYPEVLEAAFDAHGGIERWQSMRTLQFDLDRREKTERQLIDLKTRKVFIKHPEYKVGFDGDQVWVSPAKVAFGNGSARFYHNLTFYFFAMPFVVGDDGTNYEVLPQQTINGKTYDAVSVTYGSNVGDSPEDEYILHFDTATHQLELLLYTVTYFSGEKGDKYNALFYDDWQNSNGFIVPNSYKGYEFSNDSLGNQRYVRSFRNVQLDMTVPDSTLFLKPDVAEIDSLIVN